MSKRAALLGTFAVLLTAVFLVACSGEQEADAPQPTPSSAERAERSVSAAELQESQSQAEPVQEAAEQQGEAVGEVAVQEQEEEPEESPDAVEAAVESEQAETLSLLPPNVLGDPAARVHIIHFGDFQ